MKIIVTEKQLKFLVEQENSYTYEPSKSDTTARMPSEISFDDAPRDCYDLIKFMDSKITQMLSDGRTKEQIAQIFASNVKLENLPKERQDQIDPYMILRSDVIKNLKIKQGNLPINRLLNNCTKKYGLDKGVIKNKSIFKDLKINVVEIPRGSSDPAGSQCGRPNWGRASAACMKPLFTGPQYK